MTWRQRHVLKRGLLYAAAIGALWLAMEFRL